MQIDHGRRCGIARAATLVILAGAVAGCAEQSGPAPVYFRGAGEPVGGPMPMAMVPQRPAPPLQVVVRRGQTLDGYAYTYHVPKSALIAANGLRPPYELKIGQRLTIPNMHGPVQQAMAPPAARPWSPSPMPVQQAAIPLQPSSPQTIGVPASAAHPPQTIFPEPSAAAPAPPQPAVPPPSAAKSTPEVIPLDGPPPAKDAQAAPPPKPATLTPPQPLTSQAAVPLQPTAPAIAPATVQAAPAGRFPWPVRGRILAGYGNSTGSGHNEGINIAAPLGTPVRAVDSGTVAYSGNEVKGYGNIVLIRHSDGWISAYAHLGDVSVRQGEAITAGEVIGKVGNSGGVNEPQLHFELRRGQKPVNPTEFLAPAPSADGMGGSRAG